MDITEVKCLHYSQIVSSYALCEYGHTTGYMMEIIDMKGNGCGSKQCSLPYISISLTSYVNNDQCGGQVVLLQR